MFFQGQFGGSSYLAEKNWSPGKRVHSPLCGLEAFPTYRCYKKLLMFFQGPTVCFSRYREGRWSDEWGFIYPAGWVIQQEFPTPNPCLSLLYSSPPPAPFSLQSLGRFPFLLSISLSNLKKIIRLFLKSNFPQLHSIYSGNSFKGQGFWNMINKIISLGYIK